MPLRRVRRVVSPEELAEAAAAAEAQGQTDLVAYLGDAVTPEMMARAREKVAKGVVRNPPWSTAGSIAPFSIGTMLFSRAVFLFVSCSLSLSLSLFFSLSLSRSLSLP